MNLEMPEIRYARSGNVSIAYQVVGDGPSDLVFVPWMMNLAWAWEQPLFSAFCQRLASFSRLILLDKRGTGLSDRPQELPTLETRMDDIRAVMDAAGSKEASLVGAGAAGGQLCALFAATHPERTCSLVLHDTLPRVVEAPEYPAGDPLDLWEDRIRRTELEWGTREFHVRQLRDVFPSFADDPVFEHWFVNHERLAASPAAAAFFLRALTETDITDVLPAIRVPTLVVFHPRFEAAGLWLAERIPDARTAAIDSPDLSIYANPATVGAIEEFVTGRRAMPVPARVLTTLLFTDIVGSTELASTLGDRRWTDLLARHHSVVRAQLERFGGREEKTVGDGFFATFDGPARAVLCGLAAATDLAAMGLDIRVGVHTGEVERRGDELGGIAVHVAARIASEAGAGEVLVSSIVKDLTAGSGLEFADRGSRSLKGMSGEWPLFAASTTGG
jgi:class 3 adenylate cyclase